MYDRNIKIWLQEKLQNNSKEGTMNCAQKYRLL